jgi:hypothetical protein
MRAERAQAAITNIEVINDKTKKMMTRFIRFLTKTTPFKLIACPPILKEGGRFVTSTIELTAISI